MLAIRLESGLDYGKIPACVTDFSISIRRPGPPGLRSGKSLKITPA